MSLAAEAGATIYPLMPVLYNHPATVDDMISHYVNRVLQHMGSPKRCLRLEAQQASYFDVGRLGDECSCGQLEVQDRLAVNNL